MFVRVPDDVEILECILFCKSLKGNASGRAAFEVVMIFSFNKKSSGSDVSHHVQMTQQL